MSAQVDAVPEFRHEALLYSGWAEFIIGTLPFIRDGLAADEPILVVVSAEKAAALRTALEGDAERVHIADMAEIGANPARIIPAWRTFVRDHGGRAAGLRGIGEPIWSGRPADELVECQRHESLLNVAFAGGRPWRLLCPYDKGQLDEAVIEEARRSHEFILEAETSTASETYRGVKACGEPFSEPLPEPGGGVEEMSFDKFGLSSVREIVLRHALAVPITRSRAIDLVAAVNEVATNAIVHGGGNGHLRIWEERTKLICEVSSDGLFDNPLADREEPDPSVTAPRGLWLANQLCDLVQIRSQPNRTVVRLHLRTDSISHLRLMPPLENGEVGAPAG